MGLKQNNDSANIDHEIKPIGIQTIKNDNRSIYADMFDRQVELIFLHT